MKEHSTANWVNLFAIAVFLAFGSGVAVAQRTNVAMVVQFALSGVRQVDQSTATPVKITNKDILSALNETGRFDFASTAQIIFLSFAGDLPTIAIRERDGANVTTTDVSSYFSITEPMEVHGGDTLTSYAIYTYTFNNRNGTSFTVSGMTTLHRGTITGPGIGPLARDKTLTSTVSGSGTVHGASLAVRGTVHGGSAKAEVD